LDRNRKKKYKYSSYGSRAYFWQYTLVF